MKFTAILSSFFMIVGAILLGYGIFTWNSEIYQTVLHGWNINVLWGIVLVLVGVGFTFFKKAFDHLEE